MNNDIHISIPSNAFNFTIKNWGQTAGQLEGWYADIPGQFDTSGVENARFVDRQALITAVGRDDAALIF